MSRFALAKEPDDALALIELSQITRRVLAGDTRPRPPLPAWTERPKQN